MGAFLTKNPPGPMGPLLMGKVNERKAKFLDSLPLSWIVEAYYCMCSLFTSAVYELLSAKLDFKSSLERNYAEIKAKVL